MNDWQETRSYQAGRKMRRYLWLFLVACGLINIVQGLRSAFTNARVMPFDVPFGVGLAFIALGVLLILAGFYVRAAQHSRAS